MKRRDFIRNSAGFAGAAIIFPKGGLQLGHGGPLKHKIGFQTWVVKDELNADFKGTLAEMASQGYEGLEMCSPPGYRNAGFEPLLRMKIGDIRDQIIDAGLECKSSHFTMRELREDLDRSMDFAGIMKLDHMIISSFGIKKEAGLDEWKEAADEANRMGEKVKERGMQFGFHNHNVEMEKRDGEVIYDVLLDRMDPDLVKMQFQLWVTIMGVKAADYFRKHPGRFISAHLSDWNGKVEEQVALGKGTIDWPDFFEAGKKGGLKNIYVEMDPAVLAESASYLKTLR